MNTYTNNKILHKNTTNKNSYNIMKRLDERIDKVVNKKIL